MQNDIVDRLRLYSERMEETRSTVLGLLLSDAADEIERLRVIVQGWEHSARNSERDIQTLRAERDEARREVCEADTDTHGGALLEAERRGWECFKEATDV